MLPTPVVLALLRVLRREPEQPDDTDLLFEQFGTDTYVLTEAMTLVFGPEDFEFSGNARHWGACCDQLEAALVDMLSQGSAPDPEPERSRAEARLNVAVHRDRSFEASARR